MDDVFEEELDDKFPDESKSADSSGAEDALLSLPLQIMALAGSVACSACCTTGRAELSSPRIVAGEDFDFSLIVVRLAELVVVVVAALFCRLAVRGGPELVLRQLPML